MRLENVMSEQFVRVPSDAPMWRFQVTSADATLERVRQYLPSNFRVHEQLSLLDDPRKQSLLVVTGTDVAGWTVTYVRERLLSGLIATTEPTCESRCAR